MNINTNIVVDTRNRINMAENRYIEDEYEPTDADRCPVCGSFTCEGTVHPGRCPDFDYEMSTIF